MPIRFRCAYCNQLMGIARRKAGTVVRCPTCSGQVVVPAAEASTAQGDSSAPHQPAPVLFERQDFDQLFGPGTGEPRKENPSAAAKRMPESDAPDAPPAPVDLNALTDSSPLPAAPLPGRTSGIYLSPIVAVLLGVLVLILVALAFVSGYLVGSNGG
jgi:hypothetical protein